MTIETDPATLTALLWADLSLAEAVGSGDAAVAGPRASASRFLRLFPLPG